MKLPSILAGRSLRSSLLLLLGKGSNLKSSYLPGRSGFVASSSRQLECLRKILVPHWMCRVYPLHTASGRFFLEPSKGYFIQALSLDNPALWWDSKHQAGARIFFNETRIERLRRLSSFRSRANNACPGASSSKRGFALQRLLAIRLEALAWTGKPLPQWNCLVDGFERLWAGTALYNLPWDPLLGAIVAQLRACQDTHLAYQKDGKEMFKANDCSAEVKR